MLAAIACQLSLCTSTICAHSTTPNSGYAGPAKVLGACRTMPGSAGWQSGALQIGRFASLSDVRVVYIHR
jgi:hypothetical protein